MNRRAPSACREDDLAAFLDGALSPEAALGIEAHLDGCATCRRAVAEYGRVYAGAGPVSTGDADARWIERVRTSGIRRRAIRPGATLGRYTVLELIGQGGMGRVYRGIDAKLRRAIALKVIDLATTGGPEDAESMALLLHEARAAAAIDHANAATVFDVEEADGQAFIVMELVIGETLRAKMRAPGAPLATQVGWLRDIARALAAAHARGIVHRDVKPDNVMVREDGVIKVLDFGIARRAAPKEGALASSTLASLRGPAGTLRYMAPEQLRGEPIDGRADQFAWGVLAYEMLAGKLPWSTDRDALALAAEISSVEPEPLAARAPHVPRAVADVVARAMAKAPAARFATMDDLVAALEPSLPRRGWTVATAPAVLAVALGVAIAVTGGVLFRTPRAAATPAPVPAPAGAASSEVAPAPPQPVSAPTSSQARSAPVLPARAPPAVDAPVVVRTMAGADGEPRVRAPEAKRARPAAAPRAPEPRASEPRAPEPPAPEAQPARDPMDWRK